MEHGPTRTRVGMLDNTINADDVAAALAHIPEDGAPFQQRLGLPLSRTGPLSGGMDRNGGIDILRALARQAAALLPGLVLLSRDASNTGITSSGPDLLIPLELPALRGTPISRIRGSYGKSEMREAPA